VKPSFTGKIHSALGATLEDSAFLHKGRCRQPFVAIDADSDVFCLSIGTSVLSYDSIILLLQSRSVRFLFIIVGCAFVLAGVSSWKDDDKDRYNSLCNSGRCS